MRRVAAHRALLVCVLVATLNAVAWSMITPPLQLPDEIVHVGYTQYLAETGDLPIPTGLYGTIPAEETDRALELVPWSIAGDPVWIGARSEVVERRLGAGGDRVSSRAGGYVASNPPLYYALAAIPYRVVHGGNLLDRIWAMRLLSALLTGALAGFVFLFLRELMPSWPLGWRIGALGVALHPVVAFLGGGVTPEILLWVVNAALFWLIARAFRRGLTVRRGVVIGAAIAAGLLSKLTMLTLVPGLAVAVALLVYAAPKEARRRAALGAVAAGATAFVGYEGWRIASDVLFEQPPVVGVLNRSSDLTLREGFSYLWQFYLPKLPFMLDQFTSYPTYPVWEVYFQGFVGRFGWFQFGFPMWVNWLGLLLAAVIVAAAGAAVLRGSIPWRRRWPEALAYAAIAGSLLLLVNASGYRYLQDTGQNFEQTRYLFSLLPLYGLLLALAVRAVPRAWTAAVAGVLLVVLAGHGLFAQLLSLSRYYL